MQRTAKHHSNLPETLESRRLLSASAAAVVSPLVAQPAVVQSVATGAGITGDYFAGSDFQTAAVLRTDARIDFSWPLGRPDRSIPAGGFSARWTGTVEAPTTGTYTFYTMSDAGTQVIVNGTTVVDHLTGTTPSVQQGTLTLTAGVPVSIQVEYVSRTSGPSNIKLLWSSATPHKQVVPTSALVPGTGVPLPSDQALTGTYYSGFNFKQQLLTRVEPKSINFNFGTAIGGVPDSAIPGDAPFSVRWVGNIVAPTTGTYVFETITDDGVRLYVNGDKIIHDWNVHSAQSNVATIDLVAGQSYPVTMEYFQDGAGHASAQLLWALAGGGRKLKFVQFTAPPVALTAPLGVTASAFSTSQINLTWDDVTGETGFTIERSADGGATFTVAGTTGQGVTTFSDTGLNPATPYFYEVISTNGGNSSPAGSEVSATTLPAIPASAVASATVSQTTATITWPAVTGATGYLVERSPDGSTGWTSVGSTVGTSLGDTSLSHGTSYFYRVTASNVSGSAAPSNVVSVTTVPDQPDITSLTPSGSQVVVDWSAVTGATSYLVERSPNGTSGFTAVGTTSSTTLTDTGLTGGAYFYRVTASDAGGAGTPSNVATTTIALGSPTVTATTASSSEIDLTWTAVTGASSYLVERSPDGTSGWTTVATATSTSQHDTGLSPGTAYFYRVTASAGAASGAASTVVTATTLTSSPTLAATVASDTQINLSWNDVGGETGFIVQQSANGTSGWSQVGTTPQGTTTLSVPGLTGGTTYHFRVIAMDAGGNSAPSNVVNATTTTAPPAYASLTTLYGLTGGSPGLVYSINTTTGVPTQIGALSFGTNAAGRDPVSGDFYYVSTGSSTVAISAWDPTDGTNHVINASVPLDGTVALAAFRDDGTFFVATNVGDLYAINRTTGDATLKGTLQNGGSTLATATGDLAFGPDGNLYIVTGGDLYQARDSYINAATGSGSDIPTTLLATPGLGSLQIAFGNDGVLYGVDAAGQLYSGDDVNGPVTPIGSPSGITIGDLASVPLNADLSVTQAASTFTRGQTGTYTINVTNSGPDGTIAPVQVVDTLPAGLSFVSGAGTGWTFSVNGSVVTMTYSGTVHNGALPAATLTVQIDSSVTSPVVNAVTVSTNIFDQDTSNNSSSLSTSVN